MLGSRNEENGTHTNSLQLIAMLQRGSQPSPCRPLRCPRAINLTGKRDISIWIQGPPLLQNCRINRKNPKLLPPLSSSSLPGCRLPRAVACGWAEGWVVVLERWKQHPDAMLVGVMGMKREENIRHRPTRSLSAQSFLSNGRARTVNIRTSATTALFMIHCLPPPQSQPSQSAQAP